MPIENYSDITDEQFDMLREIGNIGCGNATTALSKMLDRKITMKTPKVELVEVSKFVELIGGPENPIIGILLTMSGELNGMMMFAMSQASARRLANLVLMQNSSGAEFSHMDYSALKEIGNIIMGAYMSSLASLTGMSIRSSVPQVAYDMAGAILSVPAIEFGRMGDKALLIDSSFDQADSNVDGYFVMIPELDSYNKLMSRFGM